MYGLSKKAVVYYDKYENCYCLSQCGYDDYGHETERIRVFDTLSTLLAYADAEKLKLTFIGEGARA